MRQGNNFLRYMDGNQNEKLFLFYSDNNDPSLIGELRWCKQGEKMEDAKHKFSLNTMKEMTIGKQTPVFKSPAAKEADVQRFLAFLLILVGASGGLTGFLFWVFFADVFP